MNPQNQKQPCEPGRVARFADRWNKPAIGSNRNLGLGMRMSNGMSLAALVLGTAGSALAADLTVSMMPSHHQNEHYAKAVVGQPIQVWGKASGGDYAGYTIDFGDGSAPATGESVPKPEFINSLHSYTHSGTFVASLSVTNTDGKVFDRKVNIKVVGTPSEQDKIDMAVEKGLLNLYGKASGLPDPFTFSGTQTSAHDKIAATAAAVLAFEENGHLPTNDPVADIYQNLVNQGLLYLKGQPEGPEYYQTRSFVLSTLALIQAMPRDPNAADFSQRWTGPEGELIRSRIGAVISAYNPNRSPYKGWTDDLSDQTDSTANSEASEWISYLLWKYDNVQNLFPSNLGSVIRFWESYFNINGYPVSLCNGYVFYDDRFKTVAGYDYREGFMVDNSWFSEWSLRDSGTTQDGWIGRIDNMFVLGKVSHLIVHFPDDPYYQDWQQLMSGWLMGKNELTAYDYLTGSQGAVGPSYRVPEMLYGQNADGSWSGPLLLPPNDVVSSSVATTALAVSTLIREDVTPSNDQVHAEYGSNFVSVSGGDNHAPVVTAEPYISNPGEVTVEVSDSDNDLLLVTFEIDGHQSAPVSIQSSGLVKCSSSDVKEFYGTNSITVWVDDRWSLVSETKIIARPDKEFPYFKSRSPSIEIPTDPGKSTAAYCPHDIAADRAGDGSEQIIVPTYNISYGEKLGIGTHHVIATATDPANHQTTAEYDVTVVDKEVPTISQPSITLNTDPGSMYCNYSLPKPIAMDNSGSFGWTYYLGGSAIAGSSGIFPAYAFPVGTNRVNLIVTDASNNSKSALVDVIVSDKEAPVISPIVSIRVNCDLGRGYATIPDSMKPVVRAMDNSGQNPTVVQLYPVNNQLPIGDNLIFVTATDQALNTSSSTYVVTVIDNQLPVITGSTMSISTTTSPGMAVATVYPTIPSASDNSGGVAKKFVVKDVSYPVSDPWSGVIVPIGTNVVSFVVTDPSGNTAKRTFTVTVQDKEAPKFESMPLVSVNSGGAASVAVNYPALPVTDNDGKTPVLSFSKTSGSLFPRGMTPVTVTARDSSGNTAFSTFTVYVY